MLDLFSSYSSFFLAGLGGYDYSGSSVNNQIDSSCSSIGGGGTNFHEHEYVSLPPYVHNSNNGMGCNTGGGIHEFQNNFSNNGGGGGDVPPKSMDYNPRSTARTPVRSSNGAGGGIGMSSAPNSRPNSRTRTPTSKQRRNNCEYTWYTMTGQKWGL